VQRAKVGAGWVRSFLPGGDLELVAAAVVSLAVEALAVERRRAGITPAPAPLGRCSVSVDGVRMSLCCRGGGGGGAALVLDGDDEARSAAASLAAGAASSMLAE